MSGISDAYDAVAPSYDEQLAPAQWIRDRLWERLDALFPPGSRVLDVTAGTGLDAAHLAERGVQLVACDISPRMLALLRAKYPQIETHLADYNALGVGCWDFKFDGIISTLAGLNTSPDLQPFASSAAHLLKPGGVLFIHVLNRWPLLDIARRLARGHYRQCWQLIRRSRRTMDIGGAAVTHYLKSPPSLHSGPFARSFRWQRIGGQGIVRPVGAPWGSWLEPLDKFLGSVMPFNWVGTFYYLELVRK